MRRSPSCANDVTKEIDARHASDLLHTFARGNVHVSQFPIELFVRVPFSQLFDTCPDGSVVAKVPLRIGSVDIPPGFALRARVSLAGIELDSSKVRELEIQPEGQAYRLLDCHQ